MMRGVGGSSSLVLCSLLLVAQVAEAAPPAPIARLEAPEGRFFDDPVAITPEGKSLALVSTDAASPSTLHLWSPEAKSELLASGLPTPIVALHFLAPQRVLVVYQREGSERLVAQIAAVKAGKLALEKTRLGPADSIEVIDWGGKRAIALYSRVVKKGGASHDIEVFAGETGRLVGHRSILEDTEGLLRTHVGLVRPLWWAVGHTQLAAQKIGEYDKAGDMRRPDRYARLDVVASKTLVMQEITDVLAFAKVVLGHRSSPAVEAFARLSEDHREVLVVDGLNERPMPLSRPIAVYEPSSLRSAALDDKTLLVGFQVDPGNVVAVGRRERDPDEVDLYVVERPSMTQPTPTARRVMTLPGGDRAAAFTAVVGRIALLRKGKGFDRGGVAVELYALPQ